MDIPVIDEWLDETADRVRHITGGIVSEQKYLIIFYSIFDWMSSAYSRKSASEKIIVLKTESFKIFHLPPFQNPPDVL